MMDFPISPDVPKPSMKLTEKELQHAFLAGGKMKPQMAEEPNSNYVNQDKITPSKPKIHFVYVNTPRNNRRVTVAYTYDDSINSVCFAFAECVEKDNFVKKVGRGIAINRLKNNYHTRVVPFKTIGGDSYRSITHYVVNNIKELTTF